MNEATFITLPIMPLKGAVLFPRLVQPIAAGRPETVAAVEAALASEDKEILVIAQRDSSVETPAMADLHTVGTRAVIKKAARLPEATLQIVIQGIERVVLVKLEQGRPFLRGRARLSPQQAR